MNKNRVIKAKPANDAPVTIYGRATDMTGEADASGATLTIGKSATHTARWQSAPGSEAWTGFAAEWQRLRGAA